MAPPASWSSQVSSSVPDATRKIMDGIEASFFLSEEKLKVIEEKFVHDFKLGYSKYGQAMAMIPTFVTGVPNGTETGCELYANFAPILMTNWHEFRRTFLAVDLGGTNL
jgi:hexokinase